MKVWVWVRVGIVVKSEGEVGVVGLPGKGEEGWAKARYTTAGCCDNVESLGTIGPIFVSARPVLSKGDYDLSRFPFVDDYFTYQISDGIGGYADEEASERFVKPFYEMDLSLIPYSIYDALLLAKEAAEDAEIELFQPAIEKEGGNGTVKGQALQIGLIKNRVLYATASVQAQKIKMAQNDARGVVDTFADQDLEYKEGYLQWAVGDDRDNKGRDSLCAVGSGLEDEIHLL
ncbi:small secreted [Pyrrhoderma noxium]|uniref:Small secreted n=1 Tax=Pyrrhoderma noxium TaxID=2282107 RepID=A0A286UCP2_9AGAM|nr:small secreted [Pyrrhoderma noxium]